MPVDVTVVVITHNSESVVGGLLDSIPAALDGLSADVVVVDNASTDATAKLVARRTDCRLVPSANVGYAAGFNLGVATGEPSPALLVLNPDVRLLPHSIRAMNDALVDPAVGIVAPLVLNEDGTVHRSLRREPSLRRALGLSFIGPTFSEYISERQAYEGVHDVPWALGAVLLVSRSCYDALGGWDPSYFLYSEETDFCLRAGDLGLVTRFVPEAVAVHIGGGSGQSPWTHTLQTVNRVRLYARRHRRPAAAVYYGLTVLSELSWVVRGNATQSWTAVVALLLPSRRPAELGRPSGLLPR
ncbi:MAG: glycosyltransferase family 2 protein [Lapillicoccus sp.]